MSEEGEKEEGNRMSKCLETGTLQGGEAWGVQLGTRLGSGYFMWCVGTWRPGGVAGPCRELESQCLLLSKRQLARYHPYRFLSSFIGSFIKHGRSDFSGHAFAGTGDTEIPATPSVFRTLPGSPGECIFMPSYSCIFIMAPKPHWCEESSGTLGGSGGR